MDAIKIGNIHHINKNNPGKTTGQKIKLRTFDYFNFQISRGIWNKKELENSRFFKLASLVSTY